MLLTISLFNLVGQEIVRLSAEWTTGEFSREINVSNLSQGAYFLRLQTPTFSQTKPIQVFR
ncbi:MAG: T9SS type A sorting domain-containing protein [Ignavibacteria bacterium]|nr:T9SS type A sorting domain-containing protein [Ignavibacteria bacterium]